jgi:hypothetical protein
MPTSKQRVLYEKLSNDFGGTEKWTRLTAGKKFDAMSTHNAYHHLGWLLRHGLGVEIGSLCWDKESMESARFLAKKPRASTPDFSDHSQR